MERENVCYILTGKSEQCHFIFTVPKLMYCDKEFIDFGIMMVQVSVFFCVFALKFGLWLIF